VFAFVAGDVWGNESFPQEVIDLCNIERANAKVGLPPLVLDGRLTESALRHALDMATNNFLEHTGSDGSTSSERAFDAGYPEESGGAGENIDWGWITPSGVVASWMASDDHRGNILSASAIGVAVVKSDNGWFWVQDLGSFVDEGSVPGPNSGWADISTPPPPPAKPKNVLSNVRKRVSKGQRYRVRVPRKQYVERFIKLRGPGRVKWRNGVVVDRAMRRKSKTLCCGETDNEVVGKARVVVRAVRGRRGRLRR